MGSFLFLKSEKELTRGRPKRGYLWVNIKTTLTLNEHERANFLRTYPLIGQMWLAYNLEEKEREKREVV